MKTDAGMIPTRQKISGLQASMVAEHIANGLMANWGLRNAKLIANEVKAALRAESAKRQDME